MILYSLKAPQFTLIQSVAESFLIMKNSPQYSNLVFIHPENMAKKYGWLLKISCCNHDLNLYPAEFLKWNNPTSIYGTTHYYFRDTKMRIWSWSDTSIEPGQTARTCQLSWQRLITSSSRRIRVISVYYYKYSVLALYIKLTVLFILSNKKYM